MLTPKDNEWINQYAKDKPLKRMLLGYWLTMIGTLVIIEM